MSSFSDSFNTPLKKVALGLSLIAGLIIIIVAVADTASDDGATMAPAPTPGPIYVEITVTPVPTSDASLLALMPVPTYSVIATNIIPGIKRSLDVRLSKKVSEEELRAIAVELKSNDSQQYERTFIVYYLPGMTVNAGGWATTHFNPTLDVLILGLTAQEEQALVTERASSDREVIGSWLSEFMGGRITIYREVGTLYIEMKFNDGSNLKEELQEKSSPFGRRFDIVMGSSFGDYWIIDREGNLEIRDNAGLISTAKRIQ